MAPPLALRPPLEADAPAGPFRPWAKAPLSLLMLAAVAVYLGKQWLAHRMTVGTEQSTAWTGFYLWQVSYTDKLWLGLGASLATVVTLLDLWPRALRPASRAGQWLAAAIALTWALALAMMEWLDVYELRGAIALSVVGAGFGAAYYLACRPRDRPALTRLGEAWNRHSLRWDLLAIAIASMAIYTLARIAIFDGQPIMTDAQAQIIQSRLLLNGHFALDISQRLRDVIAFPYAMMTVPSYSQYPPGHMMLMAPFLALHLPPEALTMAEGMLTIVFVVLLARRIEGPAVARAAGLLLLGSPFLTLMSVSAMNHSTAALFLWIAAWAWMPAPRGTPAVSLRRDLALYFVGGLALGWSVVARPLTGLAHGLVWGGVWIGLMADAVRKPESTSDTPRRLLAKLGVSVAGLIPPAAVFMFYNALTTGHALVMGYEVSNSELHRLGFHAATAHLIAYTPIDAINNLAADFAAFHHWMFGLAIGSWTLLLAWWLRTRFPRHQAIILALIAVQSFFYALYQFHDLFFGPRFLFETLPGMALLAAAGMGPLFRAGGKRAGTAALVLAILTAGAIHASLYGWQGRFGDPVGLSLKLDTFMSKVLPLREPTAILIQGRSNEEIGRWFPSLPGDPPLWFVWKDKEAEARRLPELQGYHWIEFDPNAM